MTIDRTSRHVSTPRIMIRQILELSLLLVSMSMISMMTPMRVSALSQQRQQQPQPAKMTQPSSSSMMMERREWFSSTAFVTGGMFGIVMAAPSSPAHAADSTSILVDELKSSQEKLNPIPQLLAEQEWDKVRTILKTPPVNKLWNLGDSQNTVLKLAKETGDVDLFELKDDLAYNLQMCDQLT
jgi:hypothetical protein